MALIRGHRSLIGVDIGSRAIKAAQLRRARGAWKVEAIASMPRATDGALLEPAEAWQLAEVLERQGFAGRNVVLAAPPEMVMAERLELPPRAAGVPIEQLARLEVARMRKCVPDSFELACWDLPTAERAAKATQVAAVACPVAGASELLDAFESSGLSVVALDTFSCALARVCASPGSAAGTVAALNLGWSAASLVVRCGEAIVYERSLHDSGLKPLLERLASDLDLEADVAEHLMFDLGLGPSRPESDDAGKVAGEARERIAEHFDALAAELRASVMYLNREYARWPVARAAVMGGGALLPGATSYLAKALELDVSEAPAADWVECPAALRPGFTAALAGSIGLAMHRP